MKRVCIIQPLLTNYCLPVFTGMSGYCHVDLIYSPSASKLGFGDVATPKMSGVSYFVVPTLRPLGERLGMIQLGIAKYIVRERPDAIVIFGNPRYLSFWTTLLLGKLLGIPTYAHGHGLFKKHRIRIPYRIMMSALLRLVTSYICYAPIVRQSFRDHGFSDHKLTVAHNSLINQYPVRPEQKTGSERGVLFIGRLRDGSNLELLVRVMEKIRQSEGILLTLHVIGTGEGAQQLQKEMTDRPWTVLYGGTYDQERIRTISLDCFLGCYPGNAGLSVVHMMSLSLPVITHDNLSSHEGPEPSFIRNGMSGVLYDHRNPEESLYKAIRSLASGTHELARMRRAAYEDYQSLVNPSLSARFWSILSSGQDSPQGGSLVAQKWAPKSPAESQAEANDSFPN